MTHFDRWRVSFEDATGSSITRQVPNPPGFSVHSARDGSSGTVSTTRRRETDLTKRQQALMSRAMAPWKQVGMLCFMMFMTTNTIQIFSLLTTFSGIATSLQAIMTSGETFKPDTGGSLDTMTPRLLFCLIHMAGVIFGVYKLNAIGLLPTHASDWFWTLKTPITSEHSSAGLIKW